MFDRKGNVIYSTVKGEPLSAFYEDGGLFVDIYAFITYASFHCYTVPKKDIEVGKTYICFVPSDAAYPTKVIVKDGKAYANIEALLAIVNSLPIDVRGVSVRYYTDRTEVYIVRDNVA